MRKSYILLILLCTLAITLVLLLAACSKASPKGATGATGQTGAQGPPGTANVIYYNWTAFNVPTWGGFDPTYFRREYSINMPSITSQLLDQGVVLAYLEYITVSNGDTTEQLIQDHTDPRRRSRHRHRPPFAD